MRLIYFISPLTAITRSLNELESWLSCSKMRANVGPYQSSSINVTSCCWSVMSLWQQLQYPTSAHSQVYTETNWFRTGLRNARNKTYQSPMIIVWSKHWAIRFKSESGDCVVYHQIQSVLTTVSCVASLRDGHWWLTHRHKLIDGLRTHIRIISDCSNSPWDRTSNESWKEL